ncbi:MAG TPA: hypothetical protein PK076_13475 [Saprospiraceae bacterium]|nr:hypothetical protein [Saprospiraceae bacterium]HQW57138.1 hypothetical protein [Saprospiraceae bacterium]
MKNKNILPLLALIITFFFSSCEVVAGIFKGGVWTGVILVVVVVGGILWLLLGGRKK